MKAIFEDVGRDHRSFEIEITDLDQLDSLTMERIVKREARLMSNEVELRHNGFGQEGSVIVGGFRPVGRFRVEP